MKEMYYLDKAKDFEYDYYFITDESSERIDKIMNDMYEKRFHKYFKIVLYLNDITYVNELIEGYMLKKYDLDEVIEYLRSKGIDI